MEFAARLVYSILLSGYFASWTIAENLVREWTSYVHRTFHKSSGMQPLQGLYCIYISEIQLLYGPCGAEFFLNVEFYLNPIPVLNPQLYLFMVPNQNPYPIFVLRKPRLEPRTEFLATNPKREPNVMWPPPHPLQTPGRFFFKGRAEPLTSATATSR